MLRRWPSVLLTSAMVTAAALGVASPSQGGSPAPGIRSADQPNVVIILTDDERVGLTDAMPVVRSRIQRAGLTFPNYMVPTTLCCPSRASLLTGKFAHGTHVWNNGLPNDPPLTGGQAGFVAGGNEPQTLAAVLDSAGYETALVGKYLNGFFESSPTPVGWDTFQPFQGHIGYYDYTLGGVAYGSEATDYSTDVIAERAVSIIENSGTEPLFLYVAPYGPHSPYTPAPRHLTAPVSDLVHDSDFIGIDENVSDKPLWVRRLDHKDVSRQQQVGRLQHRAMMSVDELTADVLDALKAAGKLANTLVVYASDNGQLWGEHHYTGKNVPYRRATEVPLYLRWDHHITQNTTKDRLALNVDVTATIAAATSVDMPWSEGRSLFSSPQRDGFVIEASAQHPPTPVRPPYCGWRTLNRMYVRYSTGEEELYLYNNDPFEFTNVAGLPKYHDSLRTMRANARAACVPVPPGFTWTP